MHAKENPTPEDIDDQNKLFQSYNVELRGQIEASIPVEKEKALPLNNERLDKYRASNFVLQFKELMLRSFRNLVRNTTFTRVRVGQIVILGILLDILFWNKSTYNEGDVRDKNGAFFFICTAQFMLAIQSVLLTCISFSLTCISSSRERFIFARTSEQNVWSSPLLFDQIICRTSLPASHAFPFFSYHLLGDKLQKRC